MAGLKLSNTLSTPNNNLNSMAFWNTATEGINEQDNAFYSMPNTQTTPGLFSNFGSTVKDWNKAFTNWKTEYGPTIETLGKGLDSSLNVLKTVGDLRAGSTGRKLAKENLAFERQKLNVAKGDALNTIETNLRKQYSNTGMSYDQALAKAAAEAPKVARDKYKLSF
jgi:hypothetical protein